jgi:hypothetical protein
VFGAGVAADHGSRGASPLVATGEGLLATNELARWSGGQQLQRTPAQPHPLPLVAVSRTRNGCLHRHELVTPAGSVGGRVGGWRQLCLAELRKAVSPLRSATALQTSDLAKSRPRLPEAQAPRVHGNPWTRSRGERPYSSHCTTSAGSRADKRSQLTQLALLWSTASCANWMQVWRMGYAGELDP